MTCINALVRASHVILATDGHAFGPDGTVNGLRQKIYPLAHADAVVAIRGPEYFPPAFVAFLNGSGLQGFDHLLRLVPIGARLTIEQALASLDPAAVAEASARIDLKRFDVVVAGWSHARRRGEIHMLTTADGQWRLEPVEGGVMMPSDSPELKARIAAHGFQFDRTDKGRDERRLLEFMEHQRAVDDVMPDGSRFKTVGGFAQMTKISAHGINTKIVKRWKS